MKKSMIAGIVMIAVAGSVQAATIGWGAATTVAGETDVSTQGTLTYAESWATTATDVNGVDFALANGVNITSESFGTQARTDNVPLTLTQSGSYYDLLRGIWYSADASKTVSLNNLTSGQEYLVQVWSSDDRYNGTQTEVVDGVSLQTNIGQYLTGTFTADATSQTFGLTGTTSGIINGLQVRAIPEPATLGLLAAFGGGILFIRRRFMI